VNSVNSFLHFFPRFFQSARRTLTLFHLLIRCLINYPLGFEIVA
jgi:hypothetical protein